MDAKLVFFKSSGQRKDFSLANPVTLIGRGEDCDLRIPLADISRRHCEVRLEEGQLKVTDLGSANGTYVNNERVTSGPLKAGDRIVVGPVVFTLQVDGEPADIKPVKTRGQMAAEGGDRDAVVDLEADVMGAGEEFIDLDEADALAASAAAAGDEVDPISALEALAADSEEEEEKKD